MDTNKNNNDNILPQYRQAACKRFLQPILTFICNPGETVHIKSDKLAQVTLAARLRDAINAYKTHNWEVFTTAQMETLKTAIVRSCSLGVFIGTRETLYSGIPFKSIFAETTVETIPINSTNDIKITDGAGLTPMLYLIENQFLSPSPIFHYTGELSPEFIALLPGMYPKVTHFTDPTNPNKHSFL